MVVGLTDKATQKGEGGRGGLSQFALGFGGPPKYYKSYGETPKIKQGIFYSLADRGNIAEVL